MPCRDLQSVVAGIVMYREMFYGDGTLRRINHGRWQGRYTVRHYSTALQRDPLICLDSAGFASGRRSELLSITEGVAHLKMPAVLRVCMKRKDLKVH